MVKKKIIKSNSNINLLFVAFLFQIHFFGALPDTLKVIGDFLLIVFLISTFGSIGGVFKKRFYTELANVKTYKYAVYISNLFLAYILFQIIYSISLWGDVLLVLRQARRWLIAGILYRIVLTNGLNNSKQKSIQGWLTFFISIIFIVLILNRINIVLPYNDFTYSLQGGYWVLKPFVQGSLLLYLFSILLINRYLEKNKFFYLLLFIISFLVISTLVPFRGWVIGSLVAITIMIILYLTINKKFAFIATIPIILAFLYLQSTAAYQQKAQWVTSAFSDFINVKGNYKYRYKNDISKIFILQRSEYFYNGLGFLHRESQASKNMNISNETNDTGWVEVILTGGIIGTIIFLLFYFTNLINYLYLFYKYKSINILGNFVIWLYSGITMISSNFLLWDFGFVPLVIFIIYFNLNFYKEIHSK